MKYSKKVIPYALNLPWYITWLHCTWKLSHGLEFAWGYTHLSSCCFLHFKFRRQNFIFAWVSSLLSYSFKFEIVDSCLWRMYEAYFLVFIRNGFIRNFNYQKDNSMKKNFFMCHNSIFKPKIWSFLWFELILRNSIFVTIHFDLLPSFFDRSFA